MKALFRKSISVVLTIAVLALATDLVQAQRRRPRGTASLGEMNCQKITDRASYIAINQDVPIGLEIFKAVAYLGNGPTYLEESGQVACRLAAQGEKPKFRTLTLGFGLPDNNDNSKGALVRLSIYKDGNFFEYRDVTAGQKLLWPINVTNVRSIALEAECKRRSSGNSCPALYFYQDILE
ncbi:MAG: hypothetical protein JGK24_24170 [Microcoleus sp. PH2017_29_MFU_D_A]|uniref:hypothetical protein n=1 Tax=unclassified Microcoleus TaxID=2642155 RepID=UPI001DC95066|nr:MULTISPECIES: hypothetical protein [unclassified Microcoleus]MCC3419862.1 hypothetical protein [Microcoleus sp. PH2017_07_MST_O_A]MCC3513679.1 hypothetical protein [Microcoleus sp. PH2017_17_BER_D_A]MCC3606236.1 hypothetical protein [Microcoleus sp. PH2017_29_MFU_D_A]TAE64189.1 MAG: hypothetical protein EAZ86_27345 [Oscillatoriales cyanobacterium]MCC3426345.1 hypothetical protein [Microcoleus sp. PH2017_01_SCD_O_A]